MYTHHSTHTHQHHTHTHTHTYSGTLRFVGLKQSREEELHWGAVKESIRATQARDSSTAYIGELLLMDGKLLALLWPLLQCPLVCGLSSWRGYSISRLSLVHTGPPSLQPQVSTRSFQRGGSVLEAPASHVSRYPYSTPTTSYGRVMSDGEAEGGEE